MNPEAILQVIMYMICSSLALRLFPAGWPMWASLIFLGLLLIFGDDIQYYIIDKNKDNV